MSTLNFSESKPSRAVILGSKGFIGSAIAAQLTTQGLPVKALSSKELNLCAADAGDSLAQHLQPEDSLVFVSALTPDKGKDLATMKQNIAMAEAVLQAIAKKPIKQLVYISSDAVYDDNASLVNESTALAPQTFHGIMHRAREVALENQCQSRKIPLLILRPCAVYGPGDTHNGYGPNRFVRNALTEGGIKLFGGGEEKRDHIFIHDFTNIAAQSILRGASGVLNVATGDAISFADVAATAAKVANRPVDIQTSARANPITHKHFDISHLVRSFPGFKFTSITQGLKQMV